jgi:hypothetical protein
MLNPRILLTIAGLLALPAASPGADWHVSTVCGDDATADGTRAKPYRTIPAAMTIAAAGDTIRVLPSADSAADCPPLFSYPGVTVDKDLCFIGEAGPGETRCDFFAIGPDRTVTIRGFTITNLLGDGISIADNPAGDDNVTIENCVIRACAGNGIAVDNSGSGSKNYRVWVKNCVISANEKAGITIYVDWNGTMAPPGLRVENCFITKNTKRAIEVLKKPGLTQTGCGLDAGWPDVLFDFCHILLNNNGLSQFPCPPSGEPKIVVRNELTDSPEFEDEAGCDFRLKSTAVLRHKGNPACVHRNPDGTRNDPGAFGGPGAAGFYGQNGPVILRVEVEPSPQPGKVKVRVLTKER